MPRADLLALTPDDLATLTNRGTVKRAQKELDAGEVTCEFHDEESGDLVFCWSDGITCRFPAGRTVHDSVCSSGLAGISRHVVRSVLAYQRAQAGSRVEPHRSETGSGTRESSASVPTAPDRSLTTSATGDVAVAAPAGVWDPGTITDDALLAHYRKTAITQARKRFDQGVLVELTRGAKPLAKFLDDGCTVRFLVPGDLRYVSADCAESLWSTWVPQAVWAFRELPADRLAGLICLQAADLPIPRDVLGNLDGLLTELVCEGLSGVADSWPQRLARLEPALRDEGLIWPAELVVDLLHQCEMYRQHDARFEPRQVVHLLGELLARSRAILHATRAVPQPLVRGSKSDRAMEIAGGRMIGVGLGVRPGKRHTTIRAYLQDADSGSVVAVERTFADPDPKSGETPRSFADLAATVLVRGVSLAGLASSQLLLKSGKRTPSGQLILPRTASSLATHPQTFQWEQLKPPFAAESFAQLAARFESLPPSCLRPRRCTENLHVVAVEAADEVEFDAAHQQLTARLRDAQGGVAELVHPFHARAREGFNDLAEALDQRGDQVRFVCGHVRTTGRTLQIRPVSIVLDDGQRRIGMLPWLPKNLETARDASPLAENAAASDATPESPVEEFVLRLGEQLADLLLTGLSRSTSARWTELVNVAEQLGWVRLTAPLAGLADGLTSRANTLGWNAHPTVRHAKDLTVLCRLAEDC